MSEEEALLEKVLDGAKHALDPGAVPDMARLYLSSDHGGKLDAETSRESSRKPSPIAESPMAGQASLRLACILRTWLRFRLI